MIFLIFFIICIRRSAPIEDEEEEPTPEEEEDELREEPMNGDMARVCVIRLTQSRDGKKRSCRLRDPTIWLPLAAGTVSHNLGPILFYHLSVINLRLEPDDDLPLLPPVLYDAARADIPEGFPLP